MNLISFNIEENFLNNRESKVINKKKNLLFHHGCLNNKLFDEKKIKHSIVDVHEIKNRKLKKRKIQSIERTFDKLLEHLTNKLNSAHGLDFKKTYWKVLIGKWLYTLVYQSYLNWEILNKIEKKYKLNFFFSTQSKRKFVYTRKYITLSHSSKRSIKV